jgi:hypothetical protein
MHHSLGKRTTGLWTPHTRPPEPNIKFQKSTKIINNSPIVQQNTVTNAPNYQIKTDTLTNPKQFLNCHSRRMNFPTATTDESNRIQTLTNPAAAHH